MSLSVACDPRWDDDACLAYLFATRHSGKACPHCGRRGKYYRNANKPCYTCACGRSQVFPRTGTLFQDSPLPLPTWFHAIWLMAESGGRLQATALQRSLNVTYATAWRMRRKLQERAPKRRPRAFGSWLRSCLERPALCRDRGSKAGIQNRVGSR